MVVSLRGEGGCSVVFLALSSEIAVAVYLPSLSFVLCNLLFEWQGLFSLGRCSNRALPGISRPPGYDGASPTSLLPLSLP